MKYKNAIILFLMGSLLTWGLEKSALSERPKKRATTYLTAGMTESIVLDYEPKVVSTGNPGVCDFLVLREQKTIHLVPKNPGQTNITVQDATGKVRDIIPVIVTRSDLPKTLQELRALLGEIEGIELKIIGKKVLVDGEILLPSDLNRIVTVANQYQKEDVGVIASLSPVAQKIIADKIQEDVSRSLRTQEVRIRAINGKFLVEGVVDSEADAVIAVEIAKTYVPDIFVTAGEKGGFIKKPDTPRVVNLLKIKPTPPKKPGRIIRITTHYVEMNKDYAKNFQFNWSPGIQDTSEIKFTGSQVTSTITGSINTLIPKLKSATSLGQARVLESASIIVKESTTESPTKGVAKNVQKIPITVITTSGGGQQVGTEFAETGLITEVVPTIIGESDSINLSLLFDLKSLTGINEKGQPSIASNLVQTEIIVRSGESAAIGGLVTNLLGRQFNKLPESLQKQETLLFSLFRSKQFQHNKSQFIVFITPEIIPTASEGVEELKKKFRINP